MRIFQFWYDSQQNSYYKQSRILRLCLLARRYKRLHEKAINFFLSSFSRESHSSENYQTLIGYLGKVCTLTNACSQVMPIPSFHREDCLISNPHEEYGYFLKNNIWYLFELNPCYFKLLFHFKVQLTGFNCTNISQPKSIKCKVIITGMSCL